MNKKLLIAAVLGVITLGAFQVTKVSAYGGDNQMTIIKRIAERFNLNESEVKEVFDEHRTERQKTMEQNFEGRLTSLVSSGKISSEQKDLILKKHDEIKKQRDDSFANFQSLSPEERKAQMQKQHDDLEAWAKENNIDPSVFMFGFGHRGMH